MKLFAKLWIITFVIGLTNLNAAIIIDHDCIDLSDIPDRWIDSAKAKLHIGYGHTSHGSQLTSGMNALESYFSSGKYDWSHSGGAGQLHLFEGSGYGQGYLSLDCGYTGWDDETREYLDDNPQCNVIIWSWCGQVNNVDVNSHYLDNMADLESEYPDVTFVYMTGHLEGLGPSGSLYQANQTIRNYCNSNNKILFDFADIEKYTPDLDTNFQNYNATDACNYSYPGGGTRNWANDWLGNNGSDELTSISGHCSSCAHSVSLNCVKKGIACWFLWARLAGWNPNGDENTITTGTVSGSLFCAGESISIPYTIEGSYSQFNKFIAQISDRNGSFSNPIPFDTIVSNSAGTLNAVLPKDLVSGTGYRVRVISTSPARTGSPNNSDLVINELPDVTITGNEEVCAESTHDYYRNYLSGYLYSWDVINGSIIGDDNDTLCTIQWDNNSVGYVKLVMTDISTGCKDSIETGITINELPIANILGDEQVCSNRVEAYSSEDTDLDCSWSCEGGVIQGNSELPDVSVLWGEAGNGQLYLDVENSENGCQSSYTISIVIVDNPIPDIFGEESVCEFNTIIYSTTPIPDNQYSWEAIGGNIITNNDTTVTIEWDSKGLGEVTLIEESISNSCKDTVKLIVTINELPEVQINGPIAVVSDSVIEYNDGGYGNLENKWIAINGTIIGEDDRNVVQVIWDNDKEAGGLRLIQTIPETGCIDSAGIDAIITEKKLPYIEGEFIACVNKNYTYRTTSNSLLVKEWMVDGGDLQPGNNSDEAIVIWKRTGNCRIDCRFLGPSGYRDSISYEVIVNELPEVEFELKRTSICMNDEPIELNTGLPAGGQYYCNEGGIEDSQFKPDIVGVGDYIIHYEYTNENDCKNAIADTITVLAIPEKPVISEQSGILSCDENFQYQWYKDDILIDDAVQREYVPAESGRFYVEVMNESGCRNKSEGYDYEYVSVFEESSNHFDLRILPNPAMDYIEITLRDQRVNSMLQNRYIEIFDVLGQSVLRNTPSSLRDATPHLEGNKRLDVSCLNPGIYFVRVGDKFLKFVKI